MPLLIVAALSPEAAGQAAPGGPGGPGDGLEAVVEGYLAAMGPGARGAPALLAAEAEAPTGSSEGILPVPDYSGDWRTRSHLSGDWGGKRSEWASEGLTFDLYWLQVFQAVVDGGVDESSEYVTNLDLYARADLMRMGLLPGALLTCRAQSRFGDTVNYDTGLLLPVNTCSLTPLTLTPDDDVPIAVTELFYMQLLSEEWGVLVGKITTFLNANEFAGGEGRSQFMNLQLIFSAVVAQVAPYSTLAAGGIWMPSPEVTVTTLLLNTLDCSTTAGISDIGDGTSWATGIDYQYRWGDLPGGGTAKFIYAFDGSFARIGGINLDPGNGITIARKSSSWAFSWSAWQYVHVEGSIPAKIEAKDGRQDLEGFGVFLIVGLADEDTNPVSWSVAAGVGGRGMIPSRSSDTYGIGAFYNRTQDPTILQRLRNSTSGVELYYNVSLAASIELSLDVQYTRSVFPRIDDAVILGARLDILF